MLKGLKSGRRKEIKNSESEVCSVIIEHPESFTGVIDKITLVSNPCFFICPPDGGAEIEQKLTISSSGKITYTSKEWTTPIPNRFSEGRWRKSTLPKEQACEILEKIIEPFRDYKFFGFATDVGGWILTAYNTEGNEFKYEGSLYPDSFEGAEEISYYVRNALMMPDLYVFDGQDGLDNTKYIYLSVEFTEGGKTYYYQTTDTSIQVGDQVVVPVGRSDEKIVTVVGVEEFSENDVPMPLNRVKSIIEKFQMPDKVHCPVCNKQLTPDECYLIEMCAEGLGPKSGYPEIVSPELVRERVETCLSCRYHSPDRPHYLKNDPVAAHQYSSNNKHALKLDDKCGCFYCLEIFDPDEIEEYYGDEESDECGTAICPYCGIDSILPESAGFPLTKEFLGKMYKRWFDSGAGIAMHTPFGFIRVLLDGKEVGFSHSSIDIQSDFPDIDGCQYITYEFEPDGKSHVLRFIKDNVKEPGDVEPGEVLETVSFKEGDGIITLGATASFGNPEDYELDYDGTSICNGIEINITPKTKARQFEFAVSWITDLSGKDENQAWLAADPFVIRKKLEE